MAAAGMGHPGRPGPLSTAGGVLAGARGESFSAGTTPRSARSYGASTAKHAIGGEDVAKSDPSKKKSPGTGTIVYTGPTGRITMPGSHWTENPQAMEMMKAMSFTYDVPALQPRLTKFHGTRVPILVLFSLLSTEVGRLAILDTFWRRIVQHPMVWQGIYCRDYGSKSKDFGPKRCVWRTLQGRSGSLKCLCHLGTTHPADFVTVCRQITAIPGRSKEELLESYRAWRNEQNPFQKTISEQNNPSALCLEDLGGTMSTRRAESPARLTLLPVEPPLPWPIRAHASYGLNLAHVQVAYGEQMKEAVPVIPASDWSRRTPAGRPPKQPIRKASPRR